MEDSFKLRRTILIVRQNCIVSQDNLIRIKKLNSLLKTISGSNDPTSEQIGYPSKKTKELTN